MNQENKYYIPDISELHPGFEYEQIPSFTDGTVKNQEEFENGIFEKRICGVGDLPYIDRALNGTNANNGRGGVRVKYLNQADIESLGWVKYDNESLSNTNFISFHKAVHPTAIMAKSFDCIILLDNLYKQVKVFDITEQKYPLFTGIIKNKSELKRILKQLGI